MNNNKRKVGQWRHFHWLDQAVAEALQRFVFGSPDVILDQALQVVPGGQQTVVVYSAAGALSCTVLNVVGLIQHHNLVFQADVHLVKNGHSNFS